MRGKELADSISNAKPSASELLVWPLGQMGFVIKSADATLVFDLYLSRNDRCLIPAPFTPEEVTFADFFFGSHDHGDHIDRPVWKALSEASPRARFVIPAAHTARLSESLDIDISRFVGVSDGKTVDLGPALVSGVAAAHEFLDMDANSGEYPYMGFIVEIGGRRVYHAGDTCVYEGLHQKLRARGGINLMFLPINGRNGNKFRSGIIGNMTYQEAVDLAGVIAPSVVVPCHYNMHSFNLEDPQLFVDYISAKSPGQKYVLPTPFQPIRL